MTVLATRAVAGGAVAEQHVTPAGPQFSVTEHEEPASSPASLGGTIWNKQLSPASSVAAGVIVPTGYCRPAESWR